MRTVCALGLLSMALAGSLACLGPGTLNEAELCEAEGPELLQVRCLGCHSSGLDGAARAGAPEGMDFDLEDDVLWYASRIRHAAFEERSMPPTRPLPSCERAALEAYLDELEASGE